MNMEFPEDSETSDDDYNPGSGPTEIVSEVESDGDPEDALSDNEIENKRSHKRRKKTTKTKKKLKKDAHETVVTVKETLEKKELTEQEKKKQADDLWASFKKDTGFKGKSSNLDRINGKETNENNIKCVESKTDNTTKNNEKVKITQIFEFAGEEVKIEKEVHASPAEARLLNTASISELPRTGRRKGLGGIGSVLSNLGKMQKISTLEKSKLDWDKFKKDENLEEELQNFNRGKNGYLERQDFLQRTDLRRFEIEKEVRAIERNKRLNNL